MEIDVARGILEIVRGDPAELEGRSFERRTGGAQVRSTNFDDEERLGNGSVGIAMDREPTREWNRLEERRQFLEGPRLEGELRFERRIEGKMAERERTSQIRL